MSTEVAAAAVARLKVVGFERLSTAELDAWSALRASNPALDSPYFHPAFAAAVHETTGNLHVAVGQDTAGEVVALLPFRRDGRLARPAGWPAADFQGPVCAPGTAFDPADVVRAAGVRAFAFDHLVEGAAGFGPWVELTRPSPYVDLTGGLDGYLGRVSPTGRDNLGQARRRTRKAERELGPVRFVADSADPDLLDTVIELKRGQYAATGAADYFAGAGRRALMHRLLRTREGSFGGLLSAVYAGDRLLAAHFGIRCGPVLHWWFPVYDPELARLAPGWILLRTLAEASPGLGVERLDLGRGEDEYKRRAKTGETRVGEGRVSAGPLPPVVGRSLRRVRRSAIARAKRSPLGPRLRAVARRLRRR